MKQYILFILAFILVSAPAFGYYADVVVEVDNSGFVTIEGVTNTPDLLIENSAEFTSKEGKYWLLNVSPNGSYSDLVYEIHLPQGAKINYMKLPDLGRIQEQNGIVISGACEDCSLALVIQYEIDPISSLTIPFWVVLLFTLIVVMGISLYLYISQDTKYSSNLDLSKFSPRQAKILSLLQKNKGELSQAKLEQLTGFPKSSLSRNIASLVRKDVVEKFNNGMTNKIRIK